MVRESIGYCKDRDSVKLGQDRVVLFKGAKG